MRHSTSVRQDATTCRRQPNNKNTRQQFDVTSNAHQKVQVSLKREQIPIYSRLRNLLVVASQLGLKFGRPRPIMCREIAVRILLLFAFFVDHVQQAFQLKHRQGPGSVPSSPERDRKCRRCRQSDFNLVFTTIRKTDLICCLKTLARAF